MSPATLSPRDRPPFEPGDVAYYPEFRGRRLAVARCYAVRCHGRARWIVSEINADTHEAELLAHPGEKIVVRDDKGSKGE